VTAAGRAADVARPRGRMAFVVLITGATAWRSSGSPLVAAAVGAGRVRSGSFCSRCWRQRVSAGAARTRRGRRSVRAHRSFEGS
jgi:hypothetical protein